MPSFRPRSVSRIILLAGIAVGLSGCLSGQDAFYGNGSEAPDVAVMKRFLAGVGVIDPKTKPIDYKPRAPLAVPPSTTDLPDPQADVADVENLPANWPRDKDAELLALQQSRQATGTEALREANRGTRRLTIEELQAGHTAGPSRAPTAEEQRAWQKEMKDNANNRLTPTQLRTLKLNKPETAALLDAQGKPQRKYLTQPPVEYSTPAETAPLALPEKEAADTNWLDEMRDNGPR